MKNMGDGGASGVGFWPCSPKKKSDNEKKKQQLSNLLLLSPPTHKKGDGGIRS